MPDLTEQWTELTPRQAMDLQRQAASQVVTHDDLSEVDSLTGVDVGYENRETAKAAVVTLRLKDLKPIDYATATLPVPMPYIPGLLSFRECPVILKALARLKRDPDLLLCDGQGIAHPRRLGVASHIGLLTGIPAIGVGKNRLIGSHDPVPEHRGGWTPLVDQGETVGAVLRTRAGVKPVYVSPGHRVSLITAVHYVMAGTTRYRLPETTRWADGLASGKDRAWLRRLDELCGSAW